VPGWGPMLPADRVLREMRSLGITATELGAPGFLPDTPEGVRAVLATHGVELIGGFVPVVLQHASLRDDTLRSAAQTAAFLAAAGSTTFVTAVVVDADWAPRYELSAGEWTHLLAMLEELDKITADHGLLQVIHPHVNTLIETADDIDRVVNSVGTKWCLDTGHMAIGGCDPVEFARAHSDAVGHVHLKDVRMDLAARLNAGELSLMGATLEGMFCPIGQGDVDVIGAVREVRDRGFASWYVLEQDISLVEMPPEGGGPALDVADSLRFVHAAFADRI
jgi:inosose dehydratase